MINSWLYFSFKVVRGVVRLWVSLLVNNSVEGKAELQLRAARNQHFRTFVAKDNWPDLAAKHWRHNNLTPISPLKIVWLTPLGAPSLFSPHPPFSLPSPLPRSRNSSTGPGLQDNCLPQPPLLNPITQNFRQAASRTSQMKSLMHYPM